MVTLKLSLWLIPIALNVWADANGRKPNYLAMFFLRGAAVVCHGALFVTKTYGWIVEWLPILAFQLTSYWLLFELGLNVIYNIREKENRSLLYFDQKEKDSGWIDRFFARFPQLHTPAKLASAIIMIISIILIYKIYG